ncbi:hypothetical protein SASPL_105825 [Salvia splendens]|uniref:Retrotransposon gag domain-containing protein n=1 Tax=Salvia splendens TaxID=180675 RepID=A0A8X9A9N8_SALSN|nr:hypothetical protein SASPL_105825 [Salvia splendens]
MAPLPGKHGVTLCANAVDTGIIPFYTERLTLIGESRKPAWSPLECPYAFLEEFCQYCDIQPVPAGSTSEDYRLKAIPFVLKGDAGVWLSRLPEGSIRTWAEFRMIFLDRYFPASKTSALKREITEARQEYDEPLGQY